VTAPNIETCCRVIRGAQLGWSSGDLGAGYARRVATDHSERKVEGRVHFLNVDVDLAGAFDRVALLNGFGSAIDILRDGEDGCGRSVVSFELSTANPALPGVISALIALVLGLPEDARGAWDRADHRIFNIGIQAGLAPHSTEWTLSPELMAALVGIKANVTLTVYGAASL
jgi:hypothetical protein